MNKIKFDYISFSKWVGILCILFALMLVVTIIALENTGNSSLGLMTTAIEFLLYGIVIIGISKLVNLFESHYMEMKFFRKHYIEKDEKNRE